MGTAGAGVIPEKMRANEQLLRDAFQFLAGLGAVPGHASGRPQHHTAPLSGCEIGY